MTARWRCPACRTRRTDYLFLLAHCKEKGHSVCNCGGYHHAHRPGSPYCHKNPMSALLDAERAGASADELADMAVDLAFDNPGRTASVCPF